MSMKSQRPSEGPESDENAPPRQPNAIGSSQPVKEPVKKPVKEPIKKPVQESVKEPSAPASHETDQEREDREVAEKIEQKRLEHERQRIQRRELFEQQMQQLEIQQLQEEQAMLAGKSIGTSSALNKSKLGSFSGASDAASQSSADLRSVPVSRRNSDDAVDLWGGMEKMSLGDRTKATVDVLPNIGNRAGTSRIGSSSPSEATLDDNSHLSKFTERYIIDDDNDTTTNRLPSLKMNLNDDGIWNDKQGLGVGASGLGSSTSYLHRYLQMSSDDDSFPTMLSTSSSALDLAKIPHTSGLRHSESGRTSEWPQYNKSLSDHIPPVPHLPQRTNSLVGYGLTGNPEESLKSALPKLTSSYSASEIPTRFNKVPTLSAFDDLTDGEHHPSLLMKHDINAINSGEMCLQFQQGYCPRGDLCPYVHSHALSSVTHSAASMPLSPGLNMSVGTMAGSSSFYARVYNGSTGTPTNPLVNNTGFPFTVAASGFSNPPTGSNNLLRMQPQQQQSQQQQQQPQPSNSIAMANKVNQKRPATDVEANRFAGASLEGFVGQIYSLCKDQHGCRYLQKKLEEQNDKYLSIIFGEVFSHFVELMTDPFGNYLCQKLLEFCGDDQRTIIVENVAPELVNISLNMHGTRAVQKMIEFLSTPQQIAIVVVALNPSVVTLIKDLNGNHVIQKCLNRFASEDNQFIYNAISAHCVEVATHRHGCCVLQRCIDHASVSQKIQLVREITLNALTLVQDPYGNYVVQYVLDLADNRFTDALIRRFIGNVCLLSVQKFSSNVMEKCIRVAEPETRKFLIEEMINKMRLDKLLRDSYANYVVQTSLDFADPVQRAQLVECIRPLLPAIRNTPYGKRIQGKLHRDQMSAGNNSMNHLVMTGAMGMGGGMGNMNGSMAAMNGMNGTLSMGGMNGMMANHGHGVGHGLVMHNNNMGMNNGMGGMNGGMGGGMPMSNMAGMPGNMGMSMSMNNINNMNGMNSSSAPLSGPMNGNMNGNMMAFGFPGMNNHFGNMSMIGMNEQHNPYGYM
ncbi:hypothetical protein BGZ51_003403 [Haplosporangium sp. Z 767]|nr:hypothetical protein BGZ51_003403 [Haplosporangium sp. Z 767]KAF9189389.1 hypothetical protein BGZ50_000832 [Haplosporangium sp. Z 11]